MMQTALLFYRDQKEEKTRKTSTRVRVRDSSLKENRSRAVKAGDFCQ